jgi:short subunit dehydrogenase-like uncharacterized protein
LLNPDGYRGSERHEPDLKNVRRDDLYGDRWLAPFIMAQINTRVVRRSAALYESWGEPYGEGFRYQEAMDCSSRSRALGMTFGLGGFAALLSTSMGRRLVRRLGPKPGEGPSQAKMDGGFFQVRVVIEAHDGTRAFLTMKRKGDPGNRCTVAMLCESALLLASVSRESLPGGKARGGVLTPATALGLPLAERLRAAEFEIEAE